MMQSSRTFRVFVSSTFSDLKEERIALQERVFPGLRELCRQHGCRFQAIDLRWGVSEEAALDQQTMKICLEEIDRCQKVSPRPNFIVLLGNRYGWQPLPYGIPSDEYEKIRQEVTAEDRELLDVWYRRDDNSVPPVYDLQPREEEYEDFAAWEAVEKKLHSILRKAVDKLDLPAGTQTKYFASATEQEIVKGAMNTPDAREHVYGFFRDFKRLLQGEQAAYFVDLEPNNKLDRIAHEHQGNLKKRLRALLPGNTYDYEVRWTGHATTKKHIKSLCDDVHGALWSIISKEVAVLGGADSLEKEIADHEAFRNERAQHFIGRDSVRRSILEYTSAHGGCPLCIYGLGGSGKSALLSHALSEIKNANPRTNLIFRFIGATPSSSNGRSLLEGLCRQITRSYQGDETTIPTEYKQLVEDFPKRLSLATAEMPLVLVLDALDQLSDVENARNLAWLPAGFPEHVHLIVSTLQTSECLTALQKKLPSSNLLELSALTPIEGEGILDLLLKTSDRVLRPFQRLSLLSNLQECGLPLYLKLAFEQARRWKSYDKSIKLSRDIHGVIHDLFERLSSEMNHGRIMTGHSLGYISAAKNGLTEDELMDVLSSDNEVTKDFIRRSPRSPKTRRLPAIVWSRLYFDLKSYLTERSADNTSLIAFFHREFGATVADTFLVGDLKLSYHRHLAKYFEKQSLETDQDGNRVINLRKLSELLFHQMRGETWKELVHTLCNFQFIKTKCEAGMTYEFFEELTQSYDLLKKARPGFEKRLLKSMIKLIAYGTEHNTSTNLHFVHAVFAYKGSDQYKTFYQDLLKAGQHKKVLKGITSSEAIGDKLRIEFIAKYGNIQRKDGIDLYAAGKTLKKYIDEWHKLSRTRGGLDLKDLARGEYDLAYIHYLRGKLVEAMELFGKSASHAAETGDGVGEWISRCVEFWVRYLGEFNPIADFKAVLLEALSIFHRFSSGKDKNPHAERWVMNVNANLFGVAFEENDYHGAERQIALLEADVWIKYFAESYFMAPYYARQAILKGDYANAAKLFQDYFEVLNIREAGKSPVESLSREYFDWGKALFLSGEIERATETWRTGLTTRDDLANHAWKKRIQSHLRGLEGRA